MGAGRAADIVFAGGNPRRVARWSPLAAKGRAEEGEGDGDAGSGSQAAQNAKGPSCGSGGPRLRLGKFGMSVCDWNAAQSPACSARRRQRGLGSRTTSRSRAAGLFARLPHTSAEGTFESRTWFRPGGIGKGARNSRWFVVWRSAAPRSGLLGPGRDMADRLRLPADRPAAADPPVARRLRGRGLSHPAAHRPDEPETPPTPQRAELHPHRSTGFRATRSISPS